MDDRTADCDQRRTALGPALPVREVLVVGDPELDVGGAVGQSDHPVAKPQPAELELAEQELVRGPVLGHRGSPLALDNDGRRGYIHGPTDRTVNIVIFLPPNAKRGQ